MLFKTELSALIGPLPLILFYPPLFNCESFYLLLLFEEYYDIAGDENTPS
jgi:hypothetical protein